MTRTKPGIAAVVGAFGRASCICSGEEEHVAGFDESAVFFGDLGVGCFSESIREAASVEAILELALSIVVGLGHVRPSDRSLVVLAQPTPGS